MNERIQELAVKAKLMAEEDINKQISYNAELKAFAEMFAELIVRECMDQVWYTREDGINGNVSQVIKDRIKQHFGVDQ
jgi:hypothetical protein